MQCAVLRRGVSNPGAHRRFTVLESVRVPLLDLRDGRSERLDHAASDVTLTSRLPSCDRRTLPVVPMPSRSIQALSGAQNLKDLRPRCGHGPTDFRRTCQFAGAKAPSTPDSGGWLAARLAGKRGRLRAKRSRIYGPLVATGFGLTRRRKRRPWRHPPRAGSVPVPWGFAGKAERQRTA